MNETLKFDTETISGLTQVFLKCMLEELPLDEELRVLEFARGGTGELVLLNPPRTISVPLVDEDDDGTEES